MKLSLFQGGVSRKNFALFKAPDALNQLFLLTCFLDAPTLESPRMKYRDPGLPETKMVSALEKIKNAAQLKDLTDERSVVNLVPPDLMRLILTVPQEMLDLDEYEKRLRWKPTPTEGSLRLSFWREYEYAHAAHAKMHPPRIFAGICTGEYFYTLIKNPRKLAWLITPPRSYMHSLEESLEVGMIRLREILQTLPVDGRDAHKNAKVLLDITQMLDIRKHGAVTQRLETKSVNVTVDATASPPSLEDVRERLKQIEMKEQELKDRRARETGAILTYEAETLPVERK